MILSAVGDDLVIAHTSSTLGAVGVACVLGGPILFLLGEVLFRQRMIGSRSAKRAGAIAALALLSLLGGDVPALALSGLVVALLIGLAVWEYDPTRRRMIR